MYNNYFFETEVASQDQNHWMLMNKQLPKPRTYMIRR